MSGLEQMYQQVILDHARERHGEGLGRVAAEPGSEGVGESFQVNPTCGDEVTLRLRLVDAPDAAAGGSPVIAELGWEGVGCSISRASLSVMNDLVAGRSVREADRVAEDFRALMNNRGAELGDERDERLEDAIVFAGTAKFPARIKCALLGWMALRDATAKALVTGPDTTSSQEER
ncbi:nitrogen fixation NifU-like protein [Salana multivorans]|uniref:Nitrogen fixation NifU-like protein n=1 Tax=Salana multivorans TaxID=120377 RepID=A0A3N2D1Y3_9MICO|nr:SUF system NifU family Fe-S cluster assembly protein [Salana multivorans]OJX93397.1 MAG: SUF system NifU family Fe-S cluster assembly protein [Micrococcales bacterium 73-15]ROR93761.1 nitrogen fixation NifU-like protein [Salana multivorans]